MNIAKDYNKMKPYEFWDCIGKPKYICAPMVDQSELPFRMLTRKYNTNLCFTPMVHSVYNNYSFLECSQLLININRMFLMI